MESRWQNNICEHQITSQGQGDLALQRLVILAALTYWLLPVDIIPELPFDDLLVL